MRLGYLSAVFATAAALSAPGHGAQAATYCLVTEAETCAYVSMEQCLQALNGLGGFCVLDTESVAAPSRRRVSHKQ